MTDKRVILGIIIFIIFGLFIYSFAATPNNRDLDGQKTQSPNNPSGEDKPIDKDPIGEDPDGDEEDPDDKEPGEEDPDGDEEDPDGDNNSGNEGSTTKPSNPGNSGSTTKPSNPGNSGSTTKPSNPGNSGNTGDNNKPDVPDIPDVPEVPDEPDVPRPTVPTFGVDPKEPANIHVSVSGNQITYQGEMDKKEILTLENGKRLFNYIFIKIESPDALTQEEFDNIKILYNGKEVSKNEINMDSTTKKAYLNFTQSFNDANGDSKDNLTKVEMEFYWGHGKTTKYTMIFDIVVNEKEAE